MDVNVSTNACGVVESTQQKKSAMTSIVNHGYRVRLTEKRNLPRYPLPGDSLCYEASFYPVTPPTVPGAFDTQGWLKSQGLVAYGKFVHWTVHGETWVPERSFYQFRKWIGSRFSEYLDPSETGLLLGLLAGDRSGIPDALRSDFQRSGLVHVLAISGFHVVLLAGMLMIFLKATGLPHRVVRMVAIALLFFYLLSMRQGTLYPRSFIMEAQDAAEDGDLEGLRDLCLNNGSCAAKIIGAALEQCEDGHVADHVILRDAMEDEGGRQAGMLWQRLQYLMDIAVIAPMVGLLGTVWGMMVSFSGLESGVSMINKADTLANGVSQAMYTTFGGLIVGIFAMAMYDLMRGRLNKLIGGMESACNTVLRKLAVHSRL